MEGLNEKVRQTSSKRKSIPTRQTTNQTRLQDLRTMPYHEYLQTPEWDAKRQLILARDKHRCRVCNSTEQLNVHHRTYERRGNEDLDDLTTLCQPCHEYFHNRKEQVVLPEGFEDVFRSGSFKTFDPQVPGVREAFYECVEYARDPDGWLLLVGPSGCGKTHLAIAIANQCKEKGVKVLTYSVPDLLDYLHSTPAYYEAFNQIKNAEMLVLDDLGVQQGSPWVTEKLFQLFNHRYMWDQPTVIIATPKGLQNIDERILSRLSDNSLTTSITFNHARDYRPNHPQRD